MPYDMRLLSGLGVLAAVLEGGSFVKAAEALGLSDSGVSRAIARLEARLGVRLLERTTRSLALTDAGRRFFEQAAPHLAGLEEAAIAASGSMAIPQGRLRVDVDPFFSRLVLAPRLPAFLALYPNVTLELVTRDMLGDLVADGIDVALRFGAPPGSSAVGRKLFDTRVLTVASPAYLERNGRPATPTDCGDHACLQYRDPASGRLFSWEFQRGPATLPVKVGGRLVLSDVGTMLEACLAGAGIAQVLALGIADFLASGRLIDLFPDWPDETFPLYALTPSRHAASAKVRAFIDLCRLTGSE